MRKLLFIAVFISTILQGFGQKDSLAILRYPDVLALVASYHPVVQQADLQLEFADALFLSSKGSLDPKLSLNWNQKQFQEKEYYNLLNSTLKIPTRFPIDPKISVDRNLGDYVSPEETIPEENNNLQITAGISLPVGKGLFMDERRLAIRQAEVFKDIARAEQQKLTNKIFLSVTKSYWDWLLAYQQMQLLNRSTSIARELFDRVVMDYSYGEAAVVDTIQAKITLQNRLIEYHQAQFNFTQAGLALGIHLWSENREPLEIRSNTIPDSLAIFQLLPDSIETIDLVNWALSNHPEILKLDGKSSQLSLEEKWNKESLKPELDLSYSLIDAPLTPQGDFTSPAWDDNFKFSVDFAFPLLLRKERGKLQQTRIKLQELDLETSQTEQIIKNKILTKRAEIDMTEILSAEFQSMAANYYRLLLAEFVNLDAGESDLFKLNIQTDKFIESQLKYLKTSASLQKARAELIYESGYPFLSLLAY